MEAKSVAAKALILRSTYNNGTLWTYIKDSQRDMVVNISTSGVPGCYVCTVKYSALHLYTYILILNITHAEFHRQRFSCHNVREDIIYDCQNIGFTVYIFFNFVPGGEFIVQTSVSSLQ